MLLLFLLACARKMLPPSPDRFPPRLLGCEALDRRRVELRFSEPLDTNSLYPGRYLITSDVETLKVEVVVQGVGPTSLLLFTEPQAERSYELSGVVEDMAHNQARLRARFRGLPWPDTIRPRIRSIIPGPGSTIGRGRVGLAIRFSEPMDTAYPVSYRFLPGSVVVDTGPYWGPGLDELRLLATLPSEVSTFYFLVSSQLTDLDQNPLEAWGYTWFTTDSVVPGVRVFGRLTHLGTPVSGVAVFCDSAGPRACGVAEEDGWIFLHLPEGVYEVRAGAAPSGAGVFELWGSESVEVPSDTFEIELRPERRGFDELFR